MSASFRPHPLCVCTCLSDTPDHILQSFPIRGIIFLLHGLCFCSGEIIDTPLLMMNKVKLFVMHPQHVMGSVSQEVVQSICRYS